MALCLSRHDRCSRDPGVSVSSPWVLLWGRGPCRTEPSDRGWLNAVNEQVARIGRVVVPGTARVSLQIVDALGDRLARYSFTASAPASAALRPLCDPDAPEMDEDDDGHQG